MHSNNHRSPHRASSKVPATLPAQGCRRQDSPTYTLGSPHLRRLNKRQRRSQIREVKVLVVTLQRCLFGSCPENAGLSGQLTFLFLVLDELPQTIMPPGPKRGAHHRCPRHRLPFDTGWSGGVAPSTEEIGGIHSKSLHDRCFLEQERSDGKVER